jgi:hypothetical protein
LRYFGLFLAVFVLVLAPSCWRALKSLHARNESAKSRSKRSWWQWQAQLVEMQR